MENTLNRKMALRLVGIAEIAAFARVSAQAVVNWRLRHADFPEPVAELKMGPIFMADEAETWVAAHHKRVVSARMRLFEDGIEVRR